MRICGVVAEYNPFHNGHGYQLGFIRKSGFDGIVAVMSPNAVQRGELAVCEKHLRARQALLNGADLVVELPLPYAVSGAESFAFGGICLLDALGCVDSICFGSECGDISLLKTLSELNPDGRISGYMSDGSSFASAFEEFVKNELGVEYSEILKNPNDVLGIEYLKALNRLNSRITPFCVKRHGAGHSDEKAGDGFCSAGFIRKNIDNPLIKDYMPRSSYELMNDSIKNCNAPVSLYNNEPAVLALLRTKDESEFSSLPDLSEGIENRLYSAVRNAASLDELYSLIKTKRYTMARVKRLVLSALLGIEADMKSFPPPYIRVLGCNEKGREILRQAKLTASKPIYTLHSDFVNADELSKRFYSLECRTADLYTCFMPKIKPCGLEQTENAVIIK